MDSSSTNPEILVIDWNDLGSSSSASSSCNNTHNSELFEIEFVDRENELKYDRLVTQNKIKSPFKRKHSNERLGEVVTEEDLENTNENNMKKFKDAEASSATTAGAFTTVRSDSECSSPVPSSSASEIEYETLPDVLDRRQKQIDYGKNTQGYLNFSKAFPNKKLRTREHPQTPKKNIKYSRRAWDNLIKIWRIKLHDFDTSGKDNKNPE